MRSAGILAGNYGEAGAINLYGPAYDLPEAARLWRSAPACPLGRLVSPMTDSVLLYAA
jgi:hypothetical protein